jgi:hypothetical protein
VLPRTLLDRIKNLMGGRHIGLTVQFDKAGTTLAVRLCPSSLVSKPAAATSASAALAATQSNATAGNSCAEKDVDCCAATATSATEALLFSGTLPHAAARAAAVFLVFAGIVWWLWGRAVGGGGVAEDSVLSAAGVFCGLAACLMWIRTLLFVFFQVAIKTLACSSNFDKPLPLALFPTLLPLTQKFLSFLIFFISSL